MGQSQNCRRRCSGPLPSCRPGWPNAGRNRGPHACAERARHADGTRRWLAPSAQTGAAANAAQPRTPEASLRRLRTRKTRCQRSKDLTAGRSHRRRRARSTRSPSAAMPFQGAGILPARSAPGRCPTPLPATGLMKIFHATIPAAWLMQRDDQRRLFLRRLNPPFGGSMR